MATRRILTSDQKVAELYTKFFNTDNMQVMRGTANYIASLFYPSPYSTHWEDGEPSITWADPKFSYKTYISSIN